MSGALLIANNDPTWYGVPAVKYLSAPVGSVIPFQVTYTNQSEPWTNASFDHTFMYTLTGVIDFAHPVSVPALAGLEIRGSRHIPDHTSVQFHAVAKYVNGVERDVTARAAWSMASQGVGIVHTGQVTMPSLSGATAHLLLDATYQENGSTSSAEAWVDCVSGLPMAEAAAWPMYQVNPRHTGYVPTTLNPQAFNLRWTRRLGAQFALNAVTAGDGRVFASLVRPMGDIPSLFALDAATGSTLWSKNFSGVNSVNPPSYAFGNVYVQTGNYDADSWLRCYDVETGEMAYKTHFGAQWEQYLSPTLADRSVYVDGGHYGGMYAFDAFSGDQEWFQSGLPQYDMWTPAIDQTRAYMYFGRGNYLDNAGLYAVNRVSGALDYWSYDGAYVWSTWSMKLAPVIGDAGEILVIHDHRLISYDLLARIIGWQQQDAFKGQPCVARGVIYAIDGGQLVALNELGGTERWRWQPPLGSLDGAMIVTNSHVLASTEFATYAIDLRSHQDVWSYPAAGQLALADGAILIADSQGALTAIGTLDLATPTLLLRFDVSPTTFGVQLTWQFGSPIAASEILVQRSNGEFGPWSVVDCDRTEANGTTVAVDRTSIPGTAYWYRIEVRQSEGAPIDYGPVRVVAGGSPARTHLDRVSPNPLKSATTIQFEVAGPEHVNVGIYDVTGRMVTTLVDENVLPGMYTREWSPGTDVRAGVYFLRFEAGAENATIRRLVYLK